jgi:Tol biopolymer transport system component
MISISHTQARRYIRAHLDLNKLPEDQWVALQAHLETCTKCQSYRDYLLATERDLRRTLHQRWDQAEGPIQGTATELAALVHERKAMRRLGFWMIGSAAAFLLCAIGFVAWSAGVFSQASAAPITASGQVPPTSAPVPTPTRAPARYQGVIAYEYRSGTDSASDIFLLNAVDEPANLTKNPANDHAPTWSPDGQWLAFLSDRTGKDEVFVMHISGTHLTQLTTLPEVTWREPLSWSADGQMLALIGERRIGATANTWVYLVPLDGSNAYPLGQSAGAMRAAFSPSTRHHWLAFSASDNWDGQLVIYDFDTQRDIFLRVDHVDNAFIEDYQANVSMVDLFDWSKEGTRLLYRLNFKNKSTVAGETNEKVALRVVDVNNSPASNNLSSQLLAGSLPANSFPQISWTGIQDEIAYLEIASNDKHEANAQKRCHSIHLIGVEGSKVRQSEVMGICVEDGLQRTNWRISQKSLLFIGYEPDAADQRGLYLLRFQGTQVHADWLADARGMVGPPQLRPTAGVLAIDPQPVRIATTQPPSPVPGPEVGDLLVVSTLNQRTLIDRLSPGSSQRTTINQSIGLNACPTWSTDHTQIAFISNRDNQDKSYNDMFLMDISGLNAHQITRSNDQYALSDTFALYQIPRGDTLPRTECRIWWSQDNRWLAAESVDTQEIILFPKDEKDGQVAYLPNSEYWSLAQVTSLRNGSMIVGYSGKNSISLKAFFPTTFRQDFPELWHSMDWSSINAMILSPNGKTMALGVERDSPKSGSAQGLLTASIDKINQDQLPEINLSFRYDLPDTSGYLSSDSLHWLSDGRLGYIVRYPAGRQMKAELFAIMPGSGAQPERLAAFSDNLLAAAWSPDGRWLTAITEAGRFVLDLSLAPGVAPTWVDGETSIDLDW